MGGTFAGGIEGTPAEGASAVIGLSLAMPSARVRAELEDWHPAGAPFSALILAHHNGECRNILTTDLAVVLLGSLEEFWAQRLTVLPVDRVDQLLALRADARRRFAKVAEQADGV